MLPQPQEHIWFFAATAIPDPAAALQSENPAASRLVAIATLMRRRQRTGEPRLELLWLPRDLQPAKAANEEASLIATFLQAWDKFQPQLIGYNSRAHELPLLLRRALITGVPLPGRMKELWQAGGEAAALHLDLCQLIEGESSVPMLPLTAFAPLAGIPGAPDPELPSVAELWQTGRVAAIIQQSCRAALATYLIWLRMAYISGHISHDACEEEQQLLFERLTELGERTETAFLNHFVDEWEHLRSTTGYQA